MGTHSPGVKKRSLAKITNLPKGWVQHTDPATGQYYYENNASDEKRTTWSTPQGAAIALQDSTVFDTHTYENKHYNHTSKSASGTYTTANPVGITASFEV